ncbi:phage tail protein [Conexibacter arvalis]|uniref:Microcystin-dependent protein n=1 Tax=Conexibacter arvalis TaxID=912552 RepID=A0A840IIJ2_9ACTN|nr:tail fiber protein [Conexibacter arvalis]MBB4663770.1 microcystin-dependent protein [Conexibacter arvalis]
MPYIGEIRMFAGNFEPNGWRFCDGQLLPIAEYESLFIAIGTTYGGDGEETFRLPDLRGRVPIHMSSGTALLQPYALGEAGGVDQITLTVAQIPQHQHLLMAARGGGVADGPDGRLLASPPALAPYVRETPDTPLPANAVAPAGGSQPHDNMGPSTAVSYVISLYGEFPSQA